MSHLQNKLFLMKALKNKQELSVWKNRFLECIYNRKAKREKMITEKLISIVIPVYNTAPYLEKCIDSILKQTYSNIEMILVDDGSSDGSGKICDVLQERYNNIIVLHKKNEGVCAARNDGIAIASGEYISFVDSDDYIDEDFFEILVKLMEEKHADVSFVLTRIVDEKGHVLNEKNNNGDVLEYDQDGFLADFLTGKVQIGLHSKLIKKSVMQNLFFDKKHVINEDKFFLFEVALAGSKFVGQNVSKYNYVQRKGSAVNSGFSLKWLDALYYAEKIVTIVQEKFPQYVMQAEVQRLNVIIDILIKLNRDKASICQYKDSYTNLVKQVKGYPLRKTLKYLHRKNQLLFILLKVNVSLFGILVRLKNKF